MSQFLNGGGVGKGSVSVLQNAGNRIDRDFSLHQDRLVSIPNTAGPSNAFKHPHPSSSAHLLPPQPISNAFDLADLQRQLLAPSTQASIQRSTENWAGSFVSQSQPVSRSTTWSGDFITGQNQQHAIPQVRARQASPGAPELAPWQRPAQSSVPSRYRLGPQILPAPYHPSPGPPHLPSQHLPSSQSIQNRPSAAPAKQELYQSTSEITDQIQAQPPKPLSESQNILAHTANSLYTDLEQSDVLLQNPLLAQSQFMQLIRGLGEGKVIVKDGIQNENSEEVGEGATFIPRPTRNESSNDWAKAFLGDAIAGPPREPETQTPQSATFPALLQSRASTVNHSSNTVHAHFPDQDALALPSESESSISNADRQRRKSVHFNEDFDDTAGPSASSVPNNLAEALGHQTSIPGSSTQWQEEGLEEEDDFDTDSFMQFNGPMWQARNGRIGVGDMEGWGELQNDWERHEREEANTSNGKGRSRMVEMENYLFQARNPYLADQGDADMGRQSPTHLGVLELEAAVQRDPRDYSAWYNLGLKQQENEREDQAIRALRKVVHLDPSYKPAYLALAVSLTNEGDRDGANSMLERWIDLSDSANGNKRIESQGEEDWLVMQRILVERLIGIARRNPEEIDPEVQIALGVLFNATEEYSKAEDCFLAALSVHPEDWLLYNRLGATLANGGRSNEAIAYYHKALDLHPTFVRALFNLGISHINLSQYPLAADRILAALRLQHSDATEGYASGTIGTAAKGVTSEVLWNTLRTACVHMGRHDLVEHTRSKSLAAFPTGFADSASLPANT